jgi:cell division protein FtsI/penicillin-binding protein 2
MRSVHQQGTTALARFGASIDLGSNGLQWDYVGNFALREVGSSWRIVWSPSVIEPDLVGKDRLAVVFQMPKRAQVYAASGQPLTVSRETYEIGVTPTDLTQTQVQGIADRLATVIDVPAAQIAGAIASSPGEFRELLTLSPGQYNQIKASLTGLPGLLVKPVMQPLFDNIAPDVVGSVGTETARILREDGAQYRPGMTVGLSGLELAFQRQLIGTPITGVVVQSPQGADITYLTPDGVPWNGVRSQPVRTTLQYSAQQAANSALAQAPGSAALVAVQASTGKILAVASHQAAQMPALDPLAGQYQPGQAFTMISAAGLLLLPGLTPSTAEYCRPSFLVNGRSFVNDPPQPASLARSSTFSKNFAAGCSTAFAGLSMSLPPTDLTRAANEFGIGARWQLPVSGFAGTVGPMAGEVKLAADAVGEGDVRVSPLAMALAAATADSGRWHAPTLVTGVPDPSVTVKDTMSTQVFSELRSLMHDAVLRGPGSAANAGGNVYGQAGNAPFRPRAGLRIAWFIGYRGNIAFAVAELVTSSSGSAAQLAGSFLQNAGTGS